MERLNYMPQFYYCNKQDPCYFLQIATLRLQMEVGEGS